MEVYTLSGSNSIIFFLGSHINWDHLIKEKTAPIGMNISFQSRSLLERLRPPGKQTKIYEHCLRLRTWRKQMEVYPYT